MQLKHSVYLLYVKLECSLNCGSEGDVRVGHGLQASPLEERGASMIIESSQRPAVSQLAKIGILGL